jgi:uncharacterized protein
MRIGITGATGFIGQALGSLAAASGHEAVAYTRSPQKATLPWAAELRALDTQAEMPLDANGLDALIHLAGEPILGRWSAAKKDRIWQSRVELTRKVARCVASAEKRPSVFISGSGMGYYGDRGAEWLQERHDPAADFLGKLCVAWEDEALRLNQMGLRVVTVRTGLVLGNTGGAFPLMRRAFSWAVGGRLGTGQQFMPWIHIQDQARLILFAAENARISGGLNACSPTPVTNAVFTQSLAAALRRPAVFPVPAFALRLALGELADVVLASQRALPQKALEGGFEFDHPLLDGALQQLLSS